jgi:hypothetical protein
VQARIVLSLVAAALALAPAADPAGGSRTYAVPGTAIRLSLPAPWKVVDAAHVLGSAEIAKLEQENPELGPALAAANQPTSPVKFFAFDPLTHRQFATNANVIVAPIPAGLTFDTYASALAAEIGTLSSVSRLVTSRVTLPAGRALRLSYRLRFTAGNRTIQVATLQYAFLHGAQGVVFTYTTLPQLQQAYAASFAASARSIRLG